MARSVALAALVCLTAYCGSASLASRPMEQYEVRIENNRRDAMTFYWVVGNIRQGVMARVRPLGTRTVTVPIDYRSVQHLRVMGCVGVGLNRECYVTDNTLLFSTHGTRVQVPQTSRLFVGVTGL